MNTLNQTPQHPANEELAAFALGKEVANAETIAEHVANCARCETLIAKTPRDTFLAILNKAKPGESLTGAYAPKTNPPAADELPEELRQQTKYTFLKKLGGGGMGVVYLAEHNLMKRKVAVKLIPPELIGNPAVRERFLQEVVSAAALEHPNVVRAYSAEEFGPHMLFEMEFVDGKDLGAVVKSKGPLPVNFAVNYIRQAAQALQQGMLKGLVHRDIKPGNLMLTRAGSVKVADFGLAKFSRESEKGRDRSLTGANAMMGTPDYMAPEQARNAKTADIRADIYSLGCTFFYLLTGQPPFAGESIADLILKHWDDARPDVGLLRNDVPAELSQYIQRMMAKEPADRPQTPKEVVDWLAKFAKGEAPKKDTVEEPKEGTVVAAQEKGAEDLRFQAFSPEPSTWEMGTDQRRKQPKKKWPLLAAAIGCLLVGLAFIAAAGVFRVKTKDGIIVLENLPADAEVLVDGNSVTVTSNGQAFEVRVAADQKHRLQVKRDGFKMFGSEVEVDVGGRQTIVIRLEPIKAPAVVMLPKVEGKKDVPIAEEKKDVPKVDPKEIAKKDAPIVEEKNEVLKVEPREVAKIAPKVVPKVEAKDPRPGELVEVEIANGVKMKFCWVPPGEAQLGSPKAERQEVLKQVLKQLKQVKEPAWMALEDEEVRGQFKTKGFWLAKYPVTQQEWAAVMGNNPSHFSKQGVGKANVAGRDTSRFPVESVSWHDCQDFLEKLNRTAKPPAALEKGKFALPHEDEWEYACRGGKENKQAFYFGNVLNGRQANCNGNYPFGTTTKGPYVQRTTAVGSYETAAPHPWKLCDMHGNVLQWCANWYLGEQNARVIRGGSWDGSSGGCRSANRCFGVPGASGCRIGCRVSFRLD